MQELEAGLDHIRQAPKDEGILKMIVRRPATEQREILQEAKLDLTEGLVGDNWRMRGSSKTADGSAHPELQITIMNIRVIALLAPSRDAWHWAGDQLFLDMDLSANNLPPGTRLALGSAILEVTTLPHKGCKKFAARFGEEALKFVNSPVGRELQLRGINARVAEAGVIRIGNVVRRMGK
jgi:hypothetical protein